jgi:hypothetical protein
MGVDKMTKKTKALVSILAILALASIFILVTSAAHPAYSTTGGSWTNQPFLLHGTQVVYPLYQKYLRSGDTVIIEDSNPSVFQKYKTNYFAPGVNVYIVKDIGSLTNIAANSANWQAGYDYWRYDYESGNSYEPQFTPDQVQSEKLFDQVRQYLDAYNTRTGSHAKLWVTVSWPETSDPRAKLTAWNWAQTQQHTDLLQVMVQRWQDSNVTRSISAVQQVSSTGAVGWVPQASVDDTHNKTLQGAINLIEGVYNSTTANNSISSWELSYNNNYEGLYEFLEITRGSGLPANPPAVLIIENPLTGLSPLTVSYTGAITGGIPPYSYKWFFDDHTTSTSQNPQYTYTGLGSHKTVLAITDSSGINAYATGFVTVTSLTTSPTTLTLNPISSVPWSSNVIVTGQLTATSGTGVGAKTVTFSGTGAAGLSSVTTNPDGTFSVTGLSPSTVATGWQVNANFAGGSTYGSSFVTSSYNTLKHSASLTLAISPSSPATSGAYSVSGTLTDTTTGTAINGMAISFSADSPITISSTATDSSGNYLVGGLTAPSSAGSYNTVSHFAGTSLYGAVNSAGQTLSVTSTTTSSTTTLTLNPISSVPWSSNVIVTGQLTATSGTGVGAKTVTFSGTGAAGLSSVTTNPDGTFSVTGLSPSTVATGWQVNANFAGGSTYGSSFVTSSYNTLKHSASLTLAISPSSVDANGAYSVSGTLTDTTTGTAINGMAISFSADSPIHIASTATDSSGNYLVNGLTAPHRERSYIITSHFAGTSLYGAVNSAGQTLSVTSTTTSSTTTLTLNPISSVPWSSNVIVTGQLTATSGTGVGGKTITFSGTGAAGVSSVTTNPDGTFSVSGPSPSTVATGWQVNANFAGDNTFSASSVTQSYNKLKHQISLTLVIFPSSVLHGTLYSISGKLMDASTGTSLSGMIISFNATSPITITSMTTDSNGGYVVSLVAPNTPGSYSIKAQFVGNAFYKTYSTTRTLSVT